MLKEFGHPLVVAARYRPQQSLIGPEVFPFYWFVVRLLVLVILGIEIAAGAARALFGDEPPLRIALQTWASLPMSLIAIVGVVTIVFAILERAGFPADHLRQWSPRTLPKVDDARKNIWESLFELSAGVIFIAWWIGLIHLPWTTGNPQFRIEPAPVFTALFWPILLLAAARLVQNLLEWVRPAWRLVNGALAVATTLLGLALIAMLYRAGQLAVIVPISMSAAKAAELSHGINLGLRIAIVVAGVAWAWQALAYLWQLARRRPSAA